MRTTAVRKTDHAYFVTPVLEKQEKPACTFRVHAGRFSLSFKNASAL
ncbi:hypothetical protein HMPREF3213_01911 [Heyndrickxia coagulans]|uniref:Uncharacterized protein n=1 Tax=Heyndrickxia coagulans TaxID=1398 RepID=A0A133KQ35_HEYCO|nr:hypothetical protein HMPREF3213_01911 [Heyndrickxia coagulans]